MKNPLGILDLKNKKSIRLGLLSLSTLSIISASALIYARMFDEKALNVGNPNGGAVGSGSTMPGGGFTPMIIIVLAFSVFVISISLFGFLREAFKRKASAEAGSSTTDLDTTPPVGMDLGRNSDDKNEETESSPFSG
ncbi:MAG TPA: hypothetical protein VFE98_03185 [Candidatus Bathyarchaeia archaeon]|nr:hypothetical protein [Candidatus Bathyarchaeia archaeon]